MKILDENERDNRRSGHKSQEKAFLAAKSEAKAAFSDDKVYIEKLIINPKHIEFQILADSYGNIVHLGERDCDGRAAARVPLESPVARQVGRGRAAVA